jgi:hypothetical protein
LFAYLIFKSRISSTILWSSLFIFADGKLIILFCYTLYGMVKVKRGVVKKIAIMVFIFSFLLMHFFPSVQASLEIIPAKLTITMPEGFPKEAVTYYIYATNPYSYGVNASARIENPPIERLPKGYTQITDLSWITVKPEKIYIPAGSTGKFEIIIDIPEDQKPSQYNKKWETWATISSDENRGVLEGGGARIQVELAVRLLINTPSSDKLAVAQSSYIIIVLIIAIITTCTVIFYSKKNRNKQNQKP